MKLIIGLLLVFICSCEQVTPQSQPMYLKRIQTDKLLLEWYKVSLITSEPPDYVVVSIENAKDTICQADNIADINVFKGDSIVISFCGHPEKYTNPINLKERVLGLKVTYVQSDCVITPKFRKTFK